jgi:hypothetical protein
VLKITLVFVYRTSVSTLSCLVKESRCNEGEFAISQAC